MIKKLLLKEKGLEKPRRFSTTFLKEEREKLARYREIFRELIKQMQNKNFVED